MQIIGVVFGFAGWCVCVEVAGWHGWSGIWKNLSGGIKVLLSRGVGSFEKDQRRVSCCMRGKVGYAGL